MSIIAFLDARITEDEEQARRDPGCDCFNREHSMLCGVRQRHECKAKRAIIADVSRWWTPPEERPAETDTELHARLAHPAYEYETTRGQRKAWDEADVPPGGDGWERNVDRGFEGWERFDYTEESYWRRLRPDGPRLDGGPPHVLRALASVWCDHPDYDPSWTL